MLGVQRQQGGQSLWAQQRRIPGNDEHRSIGGEFGDLVERLHGDPHRVAGAELLLLHDGDDCGGLPRE